MDNTVGTSGNDTFNAVLQANGATGTTIQPGDVINGGAGTDTLNITVAGDIGGGSDVGYTIAAVQTNSVEKVLLSNFNTRDHANAKVTVAADLMDGLQTVGMSASSATGDTVFTGMKNMVDAEMRNGAGDLTLTYNGAQVVTGTTDSQNLTVSNLTGGTFTANGIETINVNSTLVKSTLGALASDALKKVVVTGDKDLKITTALDFASNGTAAAPGAVVDASAFTGKLEITTTASEVLDIKGGSGDDTITLGSLSKNDKIDGGAGNNTVSLAVGAVGDNFAQVTNVQNAVFTGAFSNATNTLDASKMGSVKNVVVDVRDGTDAGGRATVAVSNLGLDQEVSVRRSTADATAFDADDGVNLTVSGLVNTANDSVKINLSGIDTNANKKGLGTLDVASYEAVSIASNANSTGLVKTNEINAVTATEAKSLTITGAADLTMGTVSGSKVTSVDASAMTGKLNLTLGAMDATVSLASADSTLTLADGSLNNKDTIIGGAGTDKLVVGAVTGLTATTGALNISGVETVELTTTGNNTLNLANVSGMKTLQVAGNTQTITGMDLATKIIVTAAGTLDVTAKDATGSSDTLTVEQKLDGNATTVIKAKAIENLALVVNDTGSTANQATFNLADFEGDKVTVTQAATSVTDVDVRLGTLNKAIRTVDMSGVKGPMSANASAATAAVAFSLAGTAVATVTGSAFNDTFNVAETGNITHVINGGDGTSDTLNIAVKSGFVNAGSITNVEKINVTVKAGDSISLTGATFHSSARDITINGGNSISSFTTGTIDTAITSVNASAFEGKLVAAFGDNTLDSTVTVTGSAANSADEVTASYTTAGSYKPKTVGVETLKLTAGNSSTAETFTVDLSDTSGVTSVEVNNAATTAADTFVIDKITNQSMVVVGSALSGNIFEFKLADATGAADAISIELKNASGPTIVGTPVLKTTDIETINLKASGLATTVSLAEVSITEANKFASLVVTGDKALTISALNADINVINAAGMSTGGSVVQSARSGTTAATYTGSAGADTFIMRNAADVIAAGEGADTLVVTATGALGGIIVDLSATGDQVTFFNGGANSAEQSGFVNVNLSGYTGSFGATVTAHKDGSAITGTAQTDEIIGGAGNDTITVATAGAANNDVMDGGAGANKLVLKTGSNTFATDANLVNIQTIELEGTAGVNINGQTEGFTIVTGTGNNAITLGAGADNVVFVASGGTDTITGFKASGADTLDLFGAAGSGQVIEGTKAGTAFATFALTTNTAIAANSVFKLPQSAALADAAAAAAIFEIATGEDDLKQAVATGKHVLVVGDDSGNDYDAQVFVITNSGTAISAALVGVVVGANAAAILFADIV